MPPSETDSKIATLVTALTCTITGSLFYEPFSTACGHSFEKSALKAWIEQNDTCPLCRQCATPIRPNYTLKTLLDSFIKEFPVYKYHQPICLEQLVELLLAGKIEDVLGYLEVTPDYLMEYLKTGETLLHLAAQHGCIAFLQALEKTAIPVNWNIISRKQCYNRTPLMFAVKGKHIPTIKFLLAHPHVNPIYLTHHAHESALMLAIREDLSNIALVLLNDPLIRENINDRNIRGESAFFLAAQFGLLKVIDVMLLIPGVDIECRRHGDKLSATDIARRYNQSRIVEHLTSRPILIRLMKACLAREKVFEAGLLIGEIYKVAPDDTQFITKLLADLKGYPLFLSLCQTIYTHVALFALKQKKHDLIIFLLTLKPELWNINIGDNCPILQQAAMLGKIDFLAKLFNTPGLSVPWTHWGLCYSNPAKYKPEFLYMLLHLGHPEILMSFLQQFPTYLTYPLYEGNPAIHCFIRESTPEQLNTLLKMPTVDPLQKNVRGESALHCAIQTEDVLKVKAVLDHPDFSFDWGDTDTKRFFLMAKILNKPAILMLLRTKALEQYERERTQNPHPYTRFICCGLFGLGYRKEQELEAIRTLKNVVTGKRPFEELEECQSIITSQPEIARVHRILCLP